MEILEHITVLREARGWSEYRLAKEAGIAQSTITNLYKRKNSPTVSTLEAICRAFGISLAQFFSSINDNNQLTEEQSDLLNNWVLLSKVQKEKATAYILGLLDK